MAALEVGAKAPDFALKATGGTTFRLSEALKEGKSIVLGFYRAAFSSVCGDEMTLFQEFQDEFARLNARTVGISVDNTWSNEAWADSRGITFPLLSDFWPHGAVAEKFGVFGEDGLPERALFIIDPKGVIRYSYVSPAAQNPGVDGLLEALEEL